MIDARTSVRVGAAVAGTSALIVGILGAVPASAQTYPPQTVPAPSSTTTASPTATATASPTASPTATASPSATASSTAQPTTSATASTPAVACQRVTLTPQSQRIRQGDSAEVVTGGAENAVVEVLAYTRPETEYTVVRRGVIGDNRSLTFRLVPPRNTRVFARQVECTGTVPGSNSVVINVAKTASINVRRTAGPQGGLSSQYEVYGSTLPKPVEAGERVALFERTGRPGAYRFTQLATGTVGADGTYSILRRFGRTGPITVVVRTARTLASDAGESNARTFVIR